MPGFHVGTAEIKWNGLLSDPVPLLAGIRQGVILSPLLFSAYFDIILHELKKLNKGCFLNSCCLNSFLFADDLLLLANSLSDLQLMVNKCMDVFESLDLEINYEKSGCLRIGPRFKCVCAPILGRNIPLKWVTECIPT